MKKFFLFSLLIIDCIIGGFYLSLETIKSYHVAAEMATIRAITSNEDRDICWKKNNEMSYDRQNDFAEFAMKTDAQTKEKIFQQGLLAGALSISKNIPIPTSYENFVEFQKNFNDVIKKERDDFEAKNPYRLAPVP